MKRLVAAALSALLLFVPSVGMARVGGNFATYQDVVNWAGCKATVEVQRRAEMNAWYNDGRIVLTHALVKLLTPEETLAVLLHEIGHCLQDQGNTWELMSPREIEWEADVYSAELACSLGLDGRMLVHDALAHMTIALNADPDQDSEVHGSVNDRIRHVRTAATGCRTSGETA